MSNEDDLAAAAAVLREFRNGAKIQLKAPLYAFADLGGRDLWETEIAGDICTTAAGSDLRAEFRFRIVINDLELWRGSSYTPDWFLITLAGEVIFEGEVEHPDNPEDNSGWERYGVFDPIRKEARDATFAMLATKRIEVDIIGP